MGGGGGEREAGRGAPEAKRGGGEEREGARRRGRHGGKVEGDARDGWIRGFTRVRWVTLVWSQEQKRRGLHFRSMPRVSPTEVSLGKIGPREVRCPAFSNFYSARHMFSVR